jgi:hypothetical protein
MRKSDAALARTTTPIRQRADRAAHELVCLALVLALAALLLRIALIW